MTQLTRLKNFLVGHLDHLALISLAAMAIIPFQNAHHFNPIPSFLAEWWAALFGLVACGFVFLRPSAWQAFPLPRILLSPLILILALLLQFGLGKIAFVEQALIMAAILLWACLMASLGQGLVRRRGLEWLADGLSAALIAGALLEVLVMMLQASHSAYSTHLIFPRRGSLYGNLGQANHLNDYLWLAIASALYLRGRGRISLGWLTALLAILLLASALSTSRSILLYGAALGFLGWLAARNKPDLSSLRRNAFFLLPVAILFLFISREFIPLLSSENLSGGGTLERFYAEAQNSSIRLKLWRTALQSIGEAPWLGHGMGSVPWQYFSHAINWPSGEAAPVAEHVHNLPLQLMAEFGIPLTILVLGLACWWLRDFLRKPLTLARWWLLALLAIMGLHSLLEYPLWYTFFLGPFALLLGAGDTGQRVLANGRRGLASFIVILALAGSILGILRQDFLDMERILNWRFLGQGEMNLPASVQRLLTLQANSLLSPQATVSFALMMEPVRDHLDDRRALCHSAMAFAPTERIVFKCVVLDAMAQDPVTEARLHQALAAFPEAAPRLRQELLSQVKVLPETRRLLEALPR
ncbi:MAG TPA: Wzy polymerase domain-containing protein [Rhodocyclaceae bacterium]|jgi:O-antigen ligase